VKLARWNVTLEYTKNFVCQEESSAIEPVFIFELQLGARPKMSFESFE